MLTGWADDGTTVIQCPLGELLSVAVRPEHAGSRTSAAEVLARAAWEAAGLAGEAPMGNGAQVNVQASMATISYWETRGRFTGR